MELKKEFSLLDLAAIYKKREGLHNNLKAP